jgi:hypothetical protein
VGYRIGGTCDGKEEVTDRWAIIEGVTLDGMIFFHQVNESGLTAKKAGK